MFPNALQLEGIKFHMMDNATYLSFMHMIDNGGSSSEGGGQQGGGLPSSGGGEVGDNSGGGGGGLPGSGGEG